MKVIELKEAILKNSNIELKEFITENFGTKLDIHQLKNNLQTLKKLDEDTLTMGIARMDQIETDYDHSKYLPSILTIVGLMFGIYVTIFNSWIVLVLGTLICLAILNTMYQERKIRRSSVYLRSILTQIKESESHKRSTQK